ncbi:MAG: hypothetical protein ACRC0A_07460 [Chitinophagaceae bacterium]
MRIILNIYILLLSIVFYSCTLTKQVTYFNLYKTSITFDSTIYIGVAKDSFSLLLATNLNTPIELPKHLPKWITYKIDTLSRKLIQLHFQIDSNTSTIPRKATLTIGSYSIHLFQKINVLLAQFLNYHKESLHIDITLQKDTQQLFLYHLPISTEGKIFYPNSRDTIFHNYSIISALFKNKYNIAVDWWDNKLSLGSIIDLKDTTYMFAGGDGSRRLPYLIANPLQLNAVRKKGCNPNHITFFKQINDINLFEAIGINTVIKNQKIQSLYQNGYAIFNHEESGWKPIGNEDSPFTGFFDGNNHTIDGLYIKNITSSQVGLFGKVNPSATITRVVIGKNSFLSNHYDYQDSSISYINMGSIAGENNGNIIQCKSEAKLYSEDENNTGGIVGFNYGVIAGCITKNLFINSYVGGGIVGFNYGYIMSCMSKNNHLVGDIVGSISGYNSQTISACMSKNNFLKISRYGGSLIGYNSNNIIASYAVQDSLFKNNPEASIGLLLGFNNLSGDMIGCYSAYGSNDWSLIGSTQNVQNILNYNLNTITTKELFNKLYSIPYQKFQFQNPNMTNYTGSLIWKNSIWGYPILWWE